MKSQVRSTFFSWKNTKSRNGQLSNAKWSWFQPNFIKMSPNSKTATCLTPKGAKFIDFLRKSTKTTIFRKVHETPLVSLPTERRISWFQGKFLKFNDFHENRRKTRCCIALRSRLRPDFTNSSLFHWKNDRSENTVGATFFTLFSWSHNGISRNSIKKPHLSGPPL